MFRDIAVVTGCVAMLATPVQADTFSYTCNAKARKTEINFTVDFSNKLGGKVTGIKGTIAVDGNKMDNLEASQITQTWTTDTEMNLQFGTDTNKDKWILIVQTNGRKDAKSTKGDFWLVTRSDGTTEGKINCVIK
jgi:hypothetical protein